MSLALNCLLSLYFLFKFTNSQAYSSDYYGGSGGSYFTDLNNGRITNLIWGVDYDHLNSIVILSFTNSDRSLGEEQYIDSYCPAINLTDPTEWIVAIDVYHGTCSNCNCAGCDLVQSHIFLFPFFLHLYNIFSF